MTEYILVNLGPRTAVIASSENAQGNCNANIYTQGVIPEGFLPLPKSFKVITKHLKYMDATQTILVIQNKSILDARELWPNRFID